MVFLGKNRMEQNFINVGGDTYNKSLVQKYY